MACTLDLVTRHGRALACFPFLLSEGSAYPDVMIFTGMMAAPSAGKGAGAVRRCSRQPAVQRVEDPWVAAERVNVTLGKPGGD